MNAKEGHVIHSTPKSVDTLLKEAEEAEAAERAALEAQTKAAQEAAPAPTPPAEPPPQAEPTPPPEPPPEQTPAPEPAPNAELEALKAQMAEKDARIEELTKRVRDEDGRRGGELAALKQQNEGLSNQVRELMSEMREVRKAATPRPAPQPDEPEPLANYDADIRVGVDRRSERIVDAKLKPLTDKLAEAKAEAEAARKSADEMRLARFLDKVETAVPKLQEYINDPAFNEWCKGVDDDDTRARQAILDDCVAMGKDKAMVKILQRWEAEQTQAAAKPIEPPTKGPGKPSKEAQVAIPKASGSSVPPKKTGPTKARLAELEHKLLHLGTATKEDREEYERLVDADVRGELT